MKLGLYYRLLLMDKNGKVVKDSGFKPSRSYVVQFLELIRGALAGAEALATDVNNAEFRIYLGSELATTKGRVDAAIGDDTYGVVVGTNAGSTPEANDNYKLDTKILHSAIGEAGKLNYRAVTFVTARPVGGNIDLDVTRPFINETGGTITVKEIGLICKNTSIAKYHLLLRDVVTDFDVTAGYTLTVVYTLRTTV